jgi:cytochrome c oxidase cbb3-type subunit 3
MEENTQSSQPLGNGDMETHDEEHNYDGIQELDNPPPRWIMAIFYITIGFSIIYAAYFFWFDVGDLQDAQYTKKSLQHDSKYQMAASSPDDAVMVMIDASDIEAGKAIYTEMSCFACHGMNGEGNDIGPNLTDNAWISGCDFQDVFNIIKNGNPAKGMTAFKTQLSDSRIQMVASYVLSLKGSNPANATEAQGEQCD